MRPSLHRRRRHILTRRANRHGARKGFAAFVAVAFAVSGLVMAGSALGIVGGTMGAYNYYAAGLPDPRVILDVEMPQSTHVYDRTGQRLLARFECENRESVDFADLPDHIVDATVAAEDRTFWTNDGIDYSAVVRAALANLEAGTIVQGASTITQQVIKYAGPIQEAGQPQQLDPDATPVPDEVDVDPDEDATTSEEEQAAVERDVCEPPELTFLEGRGYGDKIREQILARQVTEAHAGREGKEQILSTYLNLIFYGNGSYGIRAAAANYFGIRDLDDLTLAQAAFLAGLPQRPSFYDPYFADQGPERAIERRDQVLAAMLEEEYISRGEYREAVNTTWEEMNPSRVTSVLHEPHFVFRVQREAEQILASLGVEDPALAVRTGGYRVVTTLDHGLQQEAKDQVQHWVARLADKNVHNGALVAIDSATGEIVAYVGSVDYYNRDDPRVQGQ
ncbi:MAG TPA: transglycosylase domain-containing protein, partial [Candidatus Limnocylindrales bacterium]|nr:transglycosylase domain-containing protein [Candidatus Limnocylindrales bacterium]